MLITAETVAHGSFVFNTEIVVRPLVFVKKIHIGRAISVRNPMVRRRFQAETEVCGAMHTSQLSRSRDLANPGDFETLSL